MGILVRPQPSCCFGATRSCCSSDGGHWGSVEAQAHPGCEGLPCVTGQSSPWKLVSLAAVCEGSGVVAARTAASLPSNVCPQLGISGCGYQGQGHPFGTRVLSSFSLQWDSLGKQR